MRSSLDWASCWLFKAPWAKCELNVSAGASSESLRAELKRNKQPAKFTILIAYSTCIQWHKDTTRLARLISTVCSVNEGDNLRGLGFRSAPIRIRQDRCVPSKRLHSTPEIAGFDLPKLYVSARNCIRVLNERCDAPAQIVDSSLDSFVVARDLRKCCVGVCHLQLSACHQ